MALLRGVVQGGLPEFDFTQASGRSGWIATHDISSLAGGTNGLTLHISGADPYLAGPARDYPAGQPLWARLRLRSDQAGSCQLFYYSSAPTEANSVRFGVPAGVWIEGRVPLPPLGSGYRLRIDPPGTGATATLARLGFEVRSALPDFDFSTTPDAGEWSAAHDIASLVPTLEGLRVNISGGDPYLFGPSRPYPTNTLLWLTLRLFSEEAGVCQVFYFTDGPTEEKSVRFSVPGGTWFQTRVPLPSLGPSRRLRIDPPGSRGYCLLGRLWFEERVTYAAPTWPVPEPPQIGADAFTLTAGSLALRHSRDGQGTFALEVGGQRVAVGNNRGLVGYVITNQVRWFPVQATNGPVPEFVATSSNLVVRSIQHDPDGADWRFEQQYTVGTNGVILADSKVTVSRDRAVLYLPIFTLLPGVGTWGTNKNQALFAGIEYLDNEPSSSEADLRGPDSWRLVPDTLKSTLPLMAVQAGGRYVGIIWEPRAQLSALFDSPDREFRSGGHLMGLIFPGSNGENREQRSLLPYDPVLLRAGVPVSSQAQILGGLGDSVVPAVQQYVALKGLPPVPNTGLSATQYSERAAHGWLDSRIVETNLYRHAYWPGFNPQPAADAALWMSWLSARVGDAALAARLTNAAAQALAPVGPANYNSSQIGHIRFPLPALVFGSVMQNTAQHETHGVSLLSRFDANGVVVYTPAPGGLDYGTTHWARHANGLTASVTLALLEAAAFCGDRELLDRGLQQVRSLAQYRHGVPRGAQTWEIPLHTPDILAAAYLVRVYQLAYELYGDPAFIQEAKYWAWTGVPFVYLVPPVAAPIGAYSTIPVLGATAWTAPVWIGLPVQWCGLVYADALYRFAAYDPTGPWRTIADGIAASGIQQSWPLSDRERQGLLPDVFHLRSQLRDGPAINPATVLIPALRLLNQPSPYSFRALLRHGLRLHAPGEISGLSEKSDSVSFTVKSWSRTPYYVLVNGAKQAPKLKINGRDSSNGFPNLYWPSEGRFAVYLEGDAEVTLIYPATHALRIRSDQGLIMISWPLAASNSVVEMSPDLGDGDVWTTADLPITVFGDEWSVPVRADASRSFYRLRVWSP